MQTTVKKIVRSVKIATKAKLPYEELETELNGTVPLVILARLLQPYYASQFKDMTKDEIVKMMESFQF